jgi:hypothetical protein
VRRWRCTTHCFPVGELLLTDREIDVLFLGGWILLPVEDDTVILHLSCVTFIICRCRLSLLRALQLQPAPTTQVLPLSTIGKSPFAFLTLYLFRFIPTRVLRPTLTWPERFDCQRIRSLSLKNHNSAFIAVLLTLALQLVAFPAGAPPTR